MNNSLKPQRKIVVGGAAGGLASLLVWTLQQFNVDIPAEQAVALTALVTFIVQYFVPNLSVTPGQ